MSKSIRDFTLENGLFIEASAGTGKTYTVSALVAREIALDDTLRIGQLLITTFTRNAAAELRDRVRRRLIDTARALEIGIPVEGDELIDHLLSLGEAARPAMLANLRRAAVEFDTATVSTIHAVCSKILAVAGLPTGSGSESDSRKLIVTQKINDYLAAKAMLGTPLDPKLLVEVVMQKLSAPDAELWIAPDLDPVVRAALESLRIDIVGDGSPASPTGLVGQVQEITRNKPTYDDLLQRAAEVVTSGRYEVALGAIRDRFRIAFVDEAQDTDPLQWEVFRSIIPPLATERVLVIVGDPKQSIYRFRGADINAYISNRDDDKVETLDRNFRSDGDLVESLNLLLAGQEYGNNVPYVNVGYPSGHSGRRIGVVDPVEIVWIGKGDKENRPAVVSSARVVDLLARATIDGRAVRPDEVCVLVRSNEIGREIEQRLRVLNVPAVSGGTASVMKGDAARAIELLVSALERPHDLGRARAVLGTFLFGRPPVSADVLAVGGFDSELELIGDLSRALRADGVASVRSMLLADPSCARSILASAEADRRITDLNHVIELLHQRTGGRGVDAATVLQHIADLRALDDTAELVLRRVESDLNAVSILTIHAAKGLEFPVVVVADKWEEKKSRDLVNGTKTADQVGVKRPPVFLGDPGRGGRRHRQIDLAWVLDGVPSPSARLASEREDREEMARQFYVAVTRAEHHLSVLLPTDESEKSIGREFINEDVVGDGRQIRGVEKVADPGPYVSDPRPRPTSIASFDATTEQTYIRTSFSALTDQAGGHGKRGTHVSPGGGNDEETALFEVADTYADSTVDDGALSMRLGRIPGGTHLGTVVHEILENFVPGDENPRGQFDILVARHAAGPTFRGHRADIAAGLTAAVNTPLGPFMGGRTINSIPASDRLTELDFEMGLAHGSKKITVQTIGNVLVGLLPETDVLHGYAESLRGAEFNVPLAGLINGSVDAVLRIGSGDDSRFYITDYKTNRLDVDGDARLIDAYAPDRLMKPMFGHHYPLQALIYGTAFHRFLRWKKHPVDSDVAIAGIAYFFLRGMVDEDRLVDENTGCPYGVFQWQAPAGLWSALSDAIGGVD